MKLRFEKATDSGENICVHGGGDAAGLSILLAGVVDAKQALSSWRDFCFGAVRELVGRA